MAGLPDPGPTGLPAFDRTDGGVRAVGVLGTGMVILGAIRLACELTEFIGTYYDSAASGLIASRGLRWFLAANPPAPVLIAGWPLLLGIAVRRTRWRNLVQAGALTFLILSLGGLLSAAADWGRTSGQTIAIGSFRVPRSGWEEFSDTDRAMAIAGGIQWLLELATAIAALVLAWRGEGRPEPVDESTASRRSTFGRLALYVSAAFLLLTIRWPAWSACMELINQSKWIREFILKDDLARIRSTRRVIEPESSWAAQTRDLLGEARQEWSDRNYAGASEHYTHLGALLNGIPFSTMSSVERKLAAEAYNSWAWLLATCPEASLRNPDDSVNYARRAVELEPGDYSFWNTLGVAYFRRGAWDDALSALYRSMEMHDEGDSTDWFFLAMIHEKLGHRERAREWFDKAAGYSHRYDASNDEIYRFEVEAAASLGLPKPDRPPPIIGRRMSPFPPGLMPSAGRRGRYRMRPGGANRPPSSPAPTPPAGDAPARPGPSS